MLANELGQEWQEFGDRKNCNVFVLLHQQEVLITSYNDFSTSFLVTLTGSQSPANIK